MSNFGVFLITLGIVVLIVDYAFFVFTKMGQRSSIQYCSFSISNMIVIFAIGLISFLAGILFCL